MVKTHKSYSQWFNEATHQLAKDCFKLLGETGCAACWIYFKPNGLEFIVRGEEENTEGYQLVTSERVPGNLTVEQLTLWIRKFAQSVPVLPGD